MRAAGAVPCFRADNHAGRLKPRIARAVCAVVVVIVRRPVFVICGQGSDAEKKSPALSDDNFSEPFFVRAIGCPAWSTRNRHSSFRFSAAAKALGASRSWNCPAIFVVTL